MSETKLEHRPLTQDWSHDAHIEVRHSEQVRSIQRELRIIVNRHFPELAKRYQEPPFTEIVDHISAGLGLFRFDPDELGLSTTPRFSAGGDLNKGFPYYAAGRYDTAIPVAAVIRYIDNFIDSVLWIELPVSDGQTDGQIGEFQNQFTNMLTDAFNLIRQYMSNVPERLFDIFRDEMAMGLDPSQETFDARIGRVFMNKSFDLLYLDSVVNEYDYRNVMPDHYRIMTAYDLARDFNPDDYYGSEDYNVHNFIREHQLNGRALLQEILLTVFSVSQRNYADLYTMAKEVDADLVEGLPTSVKITPADSMGEAYYHGHLLQFRNVIETLLAIRGQQLRGE